MKHTVIIALLLLWATPVLALTADEDFDARCHAPGVRFCTGFDTDADYVSTYGPTQRITPDGLGVIRIFKDTTIKTSGAGALRFDVPPPPHGGANISGDWEGVRGPLWSPRFSQHSTMYAQYRIRLSPEMLNNTWPANKRWKTIWISEGIVPCLGGIGLAMHDVPMGSPSTYTACGGQTVVTNPDTHLWTPIGPGYSPRYSFQQGQWEQTCIYENYQYTQPGACWKWIPNKWLTFLIRFDIGTWRQTDSRIRIWFNVEGTTGYTLLNDSPNYYAYCRQYNDCAGAGAGDGYDNAGFTAYMTGLFTSEGLPDVWSHMWIDEFIVSSEFIAAPMTSGTPPEPPPVPPVPRFIGGGHFSGGGHFK